MASGKTMKDQASTPPRRADQGGTNEVTPGPKNDETSGGRSDATAADDSSKRPHERSSPARKQSPRVGGTPTRIKNMKNQQKGIQEFFMKGRNKLQPPKEINDGEDVDSQPIQGKGRGGTTGDDELNDSEEEARFAVDFSAIDVNARKKKNQAKAKKDKVEKAIAASEKIKTKKTGAKLQQKGRKKKVTIAPPRKEIELPGKMAVVGFAIRVGKGKDTKKKFDQKLMEGIKFLQHEIDETICITPRDKNKLKEWGVIKELSDIPKFQITLKKRFMDIPNEYAFSNINQEGGRTIKGSMIMHFTEEPKEVLAMAGGDLRSIGCTLFYKGCQEVETETEKVFLGIPNTIECEVVQEIMTDELTKLEKKLMIEDPTNFPHFRHNKPNFCVFSLIKMFPEGMPWEGGETGGRREPNGRMAFVIQTKRADHIRMVNLLDKAKEKELWLKHWGDTAYTVSMPSNKPDEKMEPGELENYINMVQSHGSVQLSLGAATLTGLYDANKQFDLRRLPGADNKPRPPIRKSVAEVLKSFEIGGQQLWLVISKSTRGTHTGYFSSVITGHGAYVENFSLCPAANIFWFLLRKGVVKDDVVKMIKGSFSITEQQKCTNSVYSKSKGFAVVKSKGGKSILTATKGNEAYDMTRGLSKTEKEIRAAKYGLASANDLIVYGASPGAMEAHDFSKGLDIKSLRGGTPGAKKAKSVKTLKESVMSVGETTLGSDETEENYNEQEEDKGLGGQSVFSKSMVGSKFDNDGGTEDMEHDQEEGGKEDNSEDEKFEDARETLQLDGMEMVEEDMAKRMAKATEDLDMESAEDSEQQGSDESSVLHFRPAIWDLYGPDVDNIIKAVNSISLQIQTEEGSEEHQKLKENNENFITTEVWDALRTSGGITTQQQLEYLTELGDDLNQLQNELEGCSSDEDEIKKPPTKFANPDTFAKCAWNIAGPSKGALLMYLHDLKDEHKLGREMKELGEVLDHHPMFGGKLWEMINEEAGTTHEEQEEFINEHIELVAKLVEDEELAKQQRAQNDEPANVKEPANAEAASSTSGDAEGVSEHDPG